MKKAFYFMVCFFLLSACRYERPTQNADYLGEERQNRQVKRVTEQQLVQIVFERGQKFAGELNQNLAAESKDLEKIDCARLIFEALPKEMDYVSSYRLVCDSTSQMLSKEKQIWEAYQQNWKQKLPLDENLQKIDLQTWLFTAPFFHKGNFVGMWSVILNRKELIKSL